jgi:hypothetical protein
LEIDVIKKFQEFLQGRLKFFENLANDVKKFSNRYKDLQQARAARFKKNGDYEGFSAEHAADGDFEYEQAQVGRDFDDLQ